MFILQIEHTVGDYETWKKLFDSDPLGREKSGVRHYRILRLTSNPNHVMIELEFDNLSEAEALRAKLLELWGRIVGTLIEGPQAKIVEIVETKEY